MVKDLVSVVIPTYQREKPIRKTIESVLNQTYQNFEIIVVDDGSKDKTKDVVLSYSDARIKYFYQENSGSQVARNKGLKEAIGEYISFLDCADEWYPHFLEKCLLLLKKDESDCVYVYTGIDTENGKIIPRELATLSGFIYKEGLEQGYITSPSALMVRKSCFDKIGYWDEALVASQDDDICFRLAKYYKFSLIPEILTYMCPKDAVSITSVSSRVADGWWALWQKYKNEVIENCGKQTLIKHYHSCFERYKRLHDRQKQKAVLKELLRTKFDITSLIKLIDLYIPEIYKKEKKGNRRRITILGLIKISYKK